MEVAVGRGVEGAGDGEADAEAGGGGGGGRAGGVGEGGGMGGEVRAAELDGGAGAFGYEMKRDPADVVLRGVGVRDFVTGRRKNAEFRYRRAFCRGTATETGVGMRDFVTVRRKIAEFRYRRAFCRGTATKTGVVYGFVGSSP